MLDVTLRQLTEFLFTVYPVPLTLQFFDLIAAILNCIAGLLGLDIKFVGL